jgi:hypothetical protein
MDTENLGILLQPKLNEVGFYLEGHSDSEYTGDPDTRISVNDYVLFFCGAQLARKSANTLLESGLKTRLC